MAAPVLMALAAISCIRDGQPAVQPEPEEGLLILSAGTRGEGDTDDLELGTIDHQFSSLAVYVFNAETGALEFSEVLSDIPDEGTRRVLWEATVRVSKSGKVVYALGNWYDNDCTFTTPISKTMTIAQLDALEVNGPESALVMAARKEIAVSSAIEEAGTFNLTGNVEMDRLSARIDLHLYKHADLALREVKVNKIELCNHVNNSVVWSSDSKMMPTAVVQNTYTETVSPAKTLGVVPADPIDPENPAVGEWDWSKIIAGNATGYLYTFQYVSAETTAGTNTPYIKVYVTIDGVPMEYKADLETSSDYGTYSLDRNTVYRVKGVLNSDALFLAPTIDDWTKVKSNHEFRDVTKDDFTFSLSDDAARTESGIGVQLGVTFKLDKPLGTQWVATITDGYNFGLVGTSKGSAGDAATTFHVKPKGAVGKTTELYITVDGKEIEINPARTDATNPYGNGLTYPGTATRILITHVQ